MRTLSNHITRKVADKLISLFEHERENYNKYWDDINPFVKFGCMREEKFYDRVKDYIIFKTINDEYVTLKEYLQRNESKHKNKVFYVTDTKQQAQYIKLFKDNNLEAVILNTIIDTHFIQFLEMHEKSVSFSRVDADISDILKDTASEQDKIDKETQDALEKLFREAVKDEKLKVQVENLRTTSVPAMILLPEYSRRMYDLSRFFGGQDMSNLFPTEESLVLNHKNSIIQLILKMKDKEENKEDITLLCQHVYDLALMSHKQLEPEAMTRFIERSNILLERIAKSAVQ